MTKAQVKRLRDKANARSRIFAKVANDLRLIAAEIEGLRYDALKEFDFDYTCEDENIRDVWGGCEDATDGIFLMTESLEALMGVEVNKLARLDKIAARAEQTRKGRD